MNEKADHIAHLLQKRLIGDLSVLEREELEKWYDEDPTNAAFAAHIQSDHWLTQAGQILYDYDGEKIVKKISAEFPLVATAEPVGQVRIHRTHFLKTAWFRYAAAILLLLTGIATYYFIHTSRSQTEMVQTTPSPSPSQKDDVLPGRDRAVLTLSDGRQIVLNDSANQFIADGKTSINKSNGVLTYGAALTSENSTVSYNTMNTPRGGQYRLVLPDGSQVWLNSASSLKYPTVFAGKTREVELAGEGYFEIKENKQTPFIVKTKKVDVTVLGTAFNVNAYEDEPVLATSLVYGSVKVSRGNESMVIKPNQQAVLSSANSALELSQPDMAEVLAWKNGRFKFNRAAMPEVMRQLSRWYDVEVVYEGEIPDIKFAGEMQRSLELSQVLKILERMGVQLRIEGRKLIVNKPKQQYYLLTKIYFMY